MHSIFARYDQDASGEIEFDEFVTLVNGLLGAKAGDRGWLHSLGDRANFRGLVIGCIEAKFCK